MTNQSERAARVMCNCNFFFNRVIVRLRQPESSASESGIFSRIWVMRARMTNRVTVTLTRDAGPKPHIVWFATGFSRLRREKPARALHVVGQL